MMIGGAEVTQSNIKTQTTHHDIFSKKPGLVRFSLLVKGAMVFEESPELAESFFVALLALFPFWSTAWVATSAYYIERELFHVADQIIKCVKK